VLATGNRRTTPRHSETTGFDNQGQHALREGVDLHHAYILSGDTAYTTIPVLVKQKGAEGLTIDAKAIITLMNTAGTPSPFAFLPTTVLLLGVGWGGLFILLTSTEPTLAPRWLFFFLVVIAFTGVGLPVMSFLNYRFPSEPPARVNVIVRQGLWVGVYAATAAWLQYGRVLNLALLILLGLAFFAIEWFLRLRERSQWTP
jgi:hypothetical protein